MIIYLPKYLRSKIFEKLYSNFSSSSNLWVKIFEILYCQQKTYSTFLWWKNVSLIGNTIELQQDKRKDKLKAVRWRKNYWSMIRFSWQDRIECDSFVLHVISVLTLLFNQWKKHKHKKTITDFTFEDVIFYLFKNFTEKLTIL